MSDKKGLTPLFCFNARSRKNDYHIFAYNDHLVCVHITHEKKTTILPFEDIYAVESKNNTSFTLFTMETLQGLAKKRKDYTFEATQSIAEYIEKIKLLVIEGSIHENLKPRKLLILINPFGGPGNAVQIYNEKVAPMFRASHLETEVIETEAAGHARRLATSFEIGTYDGIVCVSGDGLLHEVINGMFSRADWREAFEKTSLGVIPAGSGNALSRSLDLICPETAAFAIIKGSTHLVDAMSIHHDDGRVTISHLELLWGLFSDVDFESESMRWMGGARFTATAIVRAIALRSYPGKLTYLPEKESDDATTAPTSEENSQQPLADPHQKHFEIDDTWKVIEGNFATLSGMTVGWAGMDNWMSPYASHNDGKIDLQYTMRDELNFSTMTKYLLGLEKGAHVDFHFANYTKTKAFRIEVGEKPQEIGGLMDVDGEAYEYENLYVEVVPQFLNFYGPLMLPLPARPYTEKGFKH